MFGIFSCVCREGTAPPRYDAAFKEGAVKLVTEGGRIPKEVAAELGVSIDSLRSWLKNAGVSLGDASRSNKDAKRIRELEAQNRELRKLLADKDETIDVLKKSVGIFSKP
jgi:transposase